MRRVPIHDYPCYLVGEDGLIYREGKVIPLRPSKTKKGYLVVNLSMGGRATRRMVHRVVLEAFVGFRPEGMHGCHKDGNKSNNWLSNIAWMTPKENESHKEIHGTKAIGERNGASKLSAEQVQHIRLLKASGIKEWGAKKIAKQFGVAVSTVVRAAAGTHWNHVRSKS